MLVHSSRVCLLPLLLPLRAGPASSCRPSTSRTLSRTAHRLQLLVRHPLLPLQPQMLLGPAMLLLQLPVALQQWQAFQ